MVNLTLSTTLDMPGKLLPTAASDEDTATHALGEQSSLKSIRGSRAGALDSVLGSLKAEIGMSDGQGGHQCQHGRSHQDAGRQSREAQEGHRGP